MPGRALCVLPGLRVPNLLVGRATASRYVPAGLAKAPQYPVASITLRAHGVAVHTCACVVSAGETCADDAEQMRGGAECTVNEDCGINDRGTGGTCVNGKCSCFPGYFCPTCNTDTEPKFASGASVLAAPAVAPGLPVSPLIQRAHVVLAWCFRREVPGGQHWRGWRVLQ